MGWMLQNTKVAIKVLKDCELVEVDDPEYMIASLEAYMISLMDSDGDCACGTLREWRQALTDTLHDANVQCDNVDYIVQQLKESNALKYEPPDPLYPGAPVLALLTEDKEWHPAILLRIEEVALEQSEMMSDIIYHVEFTEYCKPQQCSRDKVVAMTDVAGDEEEDEDMGEGVCELCQRNMKMSFHHLIPKETHKRYLKKKHLPHNFKPNQIVRSAKGDKDEDHNATAVVEGNKGRATLKVECTTYFLNAYGASLCRACHSYVHSIDTNAGLAAKWNTVALLESNEKIRSWVMYASKQKVTQRGPKKVIRKR